MCLLAEKHDMPYSSMTGLLRYHCSFVLLHSLVSRGVGAGGARGASAPPLFFWGGVHCTPTFFARDDNLLSTAIPLHTFTGQMEISNCLPPPTFLVPATPLVSVSLLSLSALPTAP